MSDRTYVRNDERADAFPVGTPVLFDHFGAKDRFGIVAKRTKSSIHIAWVAPSSGIQRVVKISTKLFLTPSFEWTDGNGKVHAYEQRLGSEFGSKNVRRRA